MFERLLEDLGFQRLLTEPLQLVHLALQSPIIQAGTTCSSLPAAVSAPSTHVNSWFGATPWRRATKLTVMPGSKVSSTIRTFSAAVQRRRR